MSGADEQRQKVVLDRVLDLLGRIELSSTPPEIGNQVHRIVRQQVGNNDPYKAAKESSTREALKLYPQMRILVSEADDALDTALRLSIAGNIIDFGPKQEYDLIEVVERVLAQPFAVDDRAVFKDALQQVDQVLFLADNAGETVFDRVLIEALDVATVYAVKGGPTLNDAVLEDALAAGIDQVAEIVDTGSDAPGTILSHCSEEFRRLYDGADLIIAKGQANYETLSDDGPRLFFLLQTKCPIIAHDIGVPVASIVLKQGQVSPANRG